MGTIMVCLAIITCHGSYWNEKVSQWIWSEVKGVMNDTRTGREVDKDIGEDSR